MEDAMKRNLGLLLVTVSVALLLCSVAARANNSVAPAAFEQLKTLVGEWEGSNSAGKVTATYTLVSGETALMERLKSANEPEMITMYTVDGDHILITHYCSAGNQPQMKTETMTGKADKYTFTLLRVNGMKSPNEAHMVGLVLTLSDKDHLTQEWTYQDKGKTLAEKFLFQRKPEKAATVVPAKN
jgi:hypothetical protein